MEYVWVIDQHTNYSAPVVRRYVLVNKTAKGVRVRDFGSTSTVPPANGRVFAFTEPEAVAVMAEKCARVIEWLEKQKSRVRLVFDEPLRHIDVRMPEPHKRTGKILL